MALSSIKLFTAVITIAMLFQANHADNTTIVYTYNRIIPKAILRVHCWSKDVGDLWSGEIQPWAGWNFTFTPNEGTVYSCTFGWDSGNQFHDFTLYDQKRDGGLCPRDSTAIKCLWVVRKDGPCVELSLYNQCHVWASWLWE